MLYDKEKTEKQYKEQISICRALFKAKLGDYGASWRILRPESLTDQIYIKIMRIRNLEMIKEAKINEDDVSELIGIVNYAIIGKIQLDLGFSDIVDISSEKALELYDKTVFEAYSLMLDKNHDYGEVWRSLRSFSFTDLILSKVLRTKHLEEIKNSPSVSEGIDANYMDMLNYAIFSLIKKSELS